MKPFQSSSMKYDGKVFTILDQTKLPHTEVWLECESVSHLVDIIKRLAIRGAPAIGISASILLALLAEKGRSIDGLKEDVEVLMNARPTAVNLRNNLQRMVSCFQAKDIIQSLVETAESLYEEDKDLCDRIANLGASLIGAGDNILTHCHTGSLATAGTGTALGIIREAHRKYKDVFVWVDETRPLLQGARLTAWECKKLGIDHTIICDNMAASLMRDGRIDKIIVGSDRIAANGDFANKIGTYSLAVLAHHHDIPFYVAAPVTTVDPECQDGSAIPIEERDQSEVKGSWSSPGSSAFNPAFDVTPAGLVTAWILDNGIYSQAHVKEENWWEKQPGPWS